MNLRLITWDDMNELARLWKDNHSEEFPFPLSSMRKQLEKYVVTDDDGKIILFGVLEMNPEIIMMADLDSDPKQRASAYDLLLAKLEKDSLHYKMDILTCSVSNERWERHVKSRGFVEPRHKGLIKKLEVK